MNDLQPPSLAESRPILVADADEENARHIERQLRRAGIKNPVLSIKDGDDLHALFVSCGQSDDPKPCVLFLDPQMPGANGLDPVRWVKREECLGDLTIVLFSATGTAEEFENATELGVSLFVKKHPDLGSLSSLVNRLLGKPPEERETVEPTEELPTVPSP